MGRLLLVALGACGSRTATPKPGPIAPIVGALVVGQPWPEPVKTPLRWIRITTSLDGQPLSVRMGLACGSTIGGLTVTREFMQAGTERTIMSEPDAIEVPDPVGAVIELSTRFIKDFERQGFAVSGQFGGTADALATLGRTIQARIDHNEVPKWTDLPAELRDAGVDEETLRRQNATFMVVMKRDAVTRMIDVTRRDHRASVEVTEAIECHGDAAIGDPTVPELVIDNSAR